MRTRIEQRPEIEQRLVLVPRMLQAVEILQLSRPDLEARVEQALVENDALVRADDDVRAGEFRFDIIEAGGPDLRAHLLAQLRLVELSPRAAAIAEILVDSLDANGHLDAERAAANTGLSADADFEEALDTLRSLDPAGVAQPGPIESMLAQLTPEDPDRGPIERLLREHLEDLATRGRGRAARALGLDDSALERLLARIRALDPCPGRSFARPAERPIRPDLRVRLATSGAEVELVDGGGPRVALDRRVLAAARDPRTPTELRRDLGRRIDEARALIHALSMRRDTLLRVARALFDRQRGFLERGPAGIRPLKMQDVADAVGVHVSTVSRAVAGKYVESAHGIHALRRFFDGGRSLGQRAGREAVKAVLERLIAAEDPAAPLSDAALVRRLEAEGFKVARRTVLKYRRELGLPSSRGRRRPAPRRA